MLPLSSKSAQKKLKIILKESPYERFFQMIWAVDQLQRPAIGVNMKRYLTYPDEARTHDLTSPSMIYKWELEDLTVARLKLPFQPRKKGRQLQVRRCDQFLEMATIINSLRTLYEGYSKDLDANSVFLYLGKLRHKQFPWQRGFSTAQNFYQSGFIYGGEKSREYFKETYGFDLDTFAFGMMGLISIYASQPRFPMPIQVTDVPYITQDDFEKVCRHVSLPLSELSEFAFALAGRDIFPEYAASPLRTYPCIIMPDNSLMCPISELCAARACEGLFYDLVGAPGDVRREIGMKFEEYSIKLLEDHQPALNVIPEISYGSRRAPKKTPDILICEADEVSVVIECKATKMPVSRKFGNKDEQSNDKKIEEIAKGVYQVWKFVSECRLKNIPNIKASSGVVGLVLCLDPWTGFSFGFSEEIFAIAKKLADKNPNILPKDIVPVSICGLDDFSGLLRVSTEDRLLAVIREAGNSDRNEWHLNKIHEDMFPNENANRVLRYKDMIGDVYPNLGKIFKEIEERVVLN